MPLARPRLVLACLALLGPACSGSKPPVAPDTRERGLYAEPRQLAFTCVTPGCDTTQTVRVSLVGDRRVAIKRISLTSGAEPDFSLTSSEPSKAFILGVKSEFTLEVHFVPQGSPAPGSLELTIAYTDASGVESPDRIPPGELTVPLLRRLVGEPVLSASPARLSFGVVEPGNSKMLPIHLANVGFGNVALAVASVDAGQAELTAAVPDGLALVPDAGFDLPLTWKPLVPSYLEAQVVITPKNSDVDPAVVIAEGTSLAVPRLGLVPSGDVDFGDLPKTQGKVITRQLVNQGGADLSVQSLAVTDATGNVQASFADGGTQLVLAPLERASLRIKVNGQTPAEVDAAVQIGSNDAATPMLSFHVTGTVTEPILQLTPATLDFGAVPLGWVVSKPVELRNVGFGPLTLKNLSLISGSSTLFTLKNLPALPSELEREQRIAVEVEFRAETAATFVGSLSVETDDPATPFAEVSLAATAGQCSASCPISNGTPTCVHGTCEIGTCDVGWFDTDQSAATGCECHEVGTDPAGFCTGSADVGNLKDTDHAQTTYTGILPVDGDVDLIRFHGEDGYSWFSEDYDVRVRLMSNDATIQMCVYRYDTGSPLSDCYFANEACPQDGNFRHKGSLVSGDDADYVVKITRAAGAGPTCTPYTVYISNG